MDLLCSASRLGMLSEVKKCEDGDVSEALGYAAQGGYDDVVRHLISRGADVNRENFGGLRPLQLAMHHPNTMNILLDFDADPNLADEMGLTSLHYAAEKGNVLKLIERNADVNRASKLSVYPLHKSALNGSETATKKLIEYGAHVDVQDVRGNTPLHYASQLGFKNVVQLLLQANASSTLLNEKKQSPLDLATSQDIIDLLRR